MFSNGPSAKTAPNGDPTSDALTPSLRTQPAQGTDEVGCTTRVPTPVVHHTTRLTQAEYDALSGAELVTRYKNGDSDAYGEIYRRYHPSVFKFVKFRLHGWPPVAHEDFTQEAFARGMKAFITWQDTGREPGAVLITIARNLIIDNHRSGRHRYETGYVFLTDDAAPLGVNAPARQDEQPEEIAIRAVDDGRIEAAMARLAKNSSQQAKVVRMRIFDEYSIAEIAAALNLTEGGVKATLYRGIRTLGRDAGMRELLRERRSDLSRVLVMPPSDSTEARQARKAARRANVGDYFARPTDRNTRRELANA